MIKRERAKQDDQLADLEGKEREIRSGDAS